jgi:type IV pilus assembly protein PilW
MKTYNKGTAVRRRQSGMTLIEIMIAVTISLVLLSGIMQVFLASKQTYRIQDGTSRLQENARFAMRFLTQTIRMAGYSGCSGGSVTPVNIVDLDGDGLADPVTNFAGDGLEGYEYADLPLALTSANSLTAAEVLPDTDIIVILRGSSENVQLTGNMTTDNANIQISAASQAAVGFTDDDILFISDCEAADVFSINNVSNAGTKTTMAHSSANNTGPKLSKAYKADAVVMKLEKIAYYAGTNANGNPALFRRYMQGQNMVTEELVEGVASLQFQYGEDTTGDRHANRYVNAPNVTNFANVVAVRIGLLMHTEEEINPGTDTSTYQVLDFLVDPADDRRARHIFTNTSKLRNKGVL